MLLKDMNVDKFTAIAEDKIAQELKHLLTPTKDFHWWDTKHFDTYFDHKNESYWKNKTSLEEWKQFHTVENVTKALMIQKHIESLDYNVYHWVIETTDLMGIEYSYYDEDITPCGYLKAVIEAKGDIVVALNQFLSDSDMIISHANDIAATAF
tara:strand:+ start:14454 stop:14912 length:459 start_codon:yes stop_codon:yes gene_type:complete